MTKTLFDIVEGDLFAFDYDPKSVYMLQSLSDDGKAIVIRQATLWDDRRWVVSPGQEENANPYCGVIPMQVSYGSKLEVTPSHDSVEA